MNKQKVQNDKKQVTSVIAIPGYKIVDVLGRGGMAIVYRATQESIGRTVALKVLAPNPADDTFTERFLREAKIISDLTHPNIITVYDAGVFNSHHYMSMEYITGKTLRDARDEIPRKEKIIILKQIAMALDYAGNKGYVHRDIKPDNIMLHEDGRAVLMDFGIARGDLTSKGLTLTGKAIGTPYYMSPEQTKGINVDPRSDIYSLGVVLFQALTGRVPYEGTSFVDIGIKHIAEPIPKLPKGLEVFQTIINTSMSKKPEHRYQSAVQFAKALDAISPAELDYIQAKSALLHQAENISKTEIDTAAATLIENDIRPVANKIKSHASQQRQKPGLRIQTATRHVTSTAPAEIDITATDDFKALKRRHRLFLFVFLSGFIVAAYYNKVDLLAYWNQTLVPLAFEYLPAERLQQLGLVQTKKIIVVDKKTIVTVKKIRQLKPRSDNLAQYLFDISNIVLDSQQTVLINNSAVISQTQRRVLFESLNQQPENATPLIQYYKKLLLGNKNSTVARNGLTKLRRWFTSQLDISIKNNEYQYAASLLLLLRDNFPKSINGDKYQLYERHVTRFEKIQSHLLNATNFYNNKYYLEPPNENVLHEINAVLKLDPNNDAALVLRQKIIDVFVERVKQQQVEGRYLEALESAKSGLTVVKNDGFLKSSYQNLKRLLKLQQRVNQYLNLAQQKMDQAFYVTPNKNNAYLHYQAILNIEATNKPANQGLKKIEEKLVAQARQAIASNNISNAVLILQLIEQYYPNSVHLKNSQTALAAAIDSKQPKITDIVFSDVLMSSLDKMRKIKIQSGNNIYVGFEFKNFTKKTNYLSLKILDHTAITKLVQKTVKLNGKKGQQIVSIEIPDRELAVGNYYVEIKWGKKSLIKKSFQIFKP